MEDSTTSVLSLLIFILNNSFFEKIAINNMKKAKPQSELDVLLT
jgi:hypothetical protein